MCGARINGMLSFRHFDREATAEEKEAMRCRPRDARISDPPLGNPVELALAEGKVFTGEKRITYVHVMGKEATFNDICMDVWDHTAMRKDVVAASNIATHVIQEGQLYQHVARDMYGYHVNWVPDSLHPTVVDGKVTLAARMQSAQEEDEEENCAEEMSEEVEHERMQERGEGDNSDGHHDVDAEERIRREKRQRERTDPRRAERQRKAIVKTKKQRLHLLRTVHNAELMRKRDAHRRLHRMTNKLWKGRMYRYRLHSRFTEAT
ncbi:hypothetical protein CBR_g38184 [Chara braunii]|uniref:Uncharacterized protein n=1 Tax=Chara braunii TaxID=69332 RepID=A0A388LPS8_CHABU|nr:hypothetical protein CBR_g38184 [Chara braunii]|eukprot:GBG84212.1 hypothetical protein CBR_g38184 [Chara braunii]